METPIDSYRDPLNERKEQVENEVEEETHHLENKRKVEQPDIKMSSKKPKKTSELQEQLRSKVIESGCWENLVIDPALYSKITYNSGDAINRSDIVDPLLKFSDQSGYPFVFFEPHGGIWLDFKDKSYVNDQVADQHMIDWRDDAECNGELISVMDPFQSGCFVAFLKHGIKPTLKQLRELLESAHVNRIEYQLNRILFHRKKPVGIPKSVLNDPESLHAVLCKKWDHVRLLTRAMLYQYMIGVQSECRFN